MHSTRDTGHRGKVKKLHFGSQIRINRKVFFFLLSQSMLSRENSLRGRTTMSGLCVFPASEYCDKSPAAGEREKAGLWSPASAMSTQ